MAVDYNATGGLWGHNVWSLPEGLVNYNNPLKYYSGSLLSYDSETDGGNPVLKQWMMTSTRNFKPSRVTSFLQASNGQWQRWSSFNPAKKMQWPIADSPMVVECHWWKCLSRRRQQKWQKALLSPSQASEPMINRWTNELIGLALLWFMVRQQWVKLSELASPRLWASRTIVRWPMAQATLPRHRSGQRVHIQHSNLHDDCSIVLLVRSQSQIYTIRWFTPD